ncbi:MAG: flavin reductase family protein [Bdellovibrionales bacterium]
MGEMMKDMMKGMGAPKKKEFYPSLMTLPKLSEKERAELEERAHERMKSGAAIMNRALGELTKAAEANNPAKMKAASADVREGLAQFDSGVSTHEALSQGDSPQKIGQSWFKQNLGLEEEMDHESDEGLFSPWGLSTFHFFVMILLSVFSVAMLTMYFFKMRRAAQLLERLSSSDALNTAALPPTSKKPWKGRLVVSSIYQETPTVKTFKLTTPDHSDLPFTYVAGQFVTLTVVIEGKPIKRAYTIASHPCDKKALEVTIKREEYGLVSRYLHDVIHEGDMIELEAAYGNLTFSGVNGEGIVLIGGGVGITPLMSVLRCLIACGMKNEIHLLYACKSLTEFVYRDELKLLQERNPNLKLTVAVDKLEGEFPGAFEGRLTKEKITAAVPNISKFRVHLCGPPGMMQAMRLVLNDLKVPEEQIKTEAFGPAKAPASAAPALGTAPAQTVAEPSTAKSVSKVTFKKAGKTVSIQPNETVLELAESSGVDIPYSCRVGTCGACKVKLSSGQVAMEVQDSLTEEDKRSGLILACQAKAQSDLEIEEP